MASASIGGYSVEVIHANDKERFKCMLCLQIIKDATHGCMSHVFCKTCIMEYIKRNKNKKQLICPAGCRILFDKDRLHSNNPINQFVNQLACKCPDCNWRGELSDFVQKHERTCEEKKVLCSLCKELVKKKHINKHALEVCRNRKVQCKYCLNQFSFTEHSKHEVACGNEKADCFLKKFGCNETMKRKMVDVHNEKSNCKHLKIITDHFTNEHIRLRSDNDMLVMKSIELESSLRNVKKDLQLVNLENEITIETLTQLKQENTQLKSANESFQEVSSKYDQIDEKLCDLENETIYLKNSLSSVFLKALKPVLLKKAVKNVVEISRNGALMIKEFKLSYFELKECFNDGNYAKIADNLAAACDELMDYSVELKELISARSVIKFYKSAEITYLFFKTKTFTSYEDKFVILKKNGNQYFYSPKKTVGIDLAMLSLYKWDINMAKEYVIDMSMQDNFESAITPFTSHKYGCFTVKLSSES